MLVELHEERVERHPHTIQEHIWLIYSPLDYTSAEKIASLRSLMWVEASITWWYSPGSMRQSTPAKRSEGPVTCLQE